MIPLSVRMTGWMRYRERQTADFSGGTLIAICGENGAGKSSIFDAITYALYGTHRLGKQHADQLISQGADRLAVEFEFEADGRRYLLRRSHGKRESEREHGFWCWDEGAADWTQVAGTEKKDALERTIASIVRISEPAFMSSFLLQQGEATQFLDADPKDRFEIISSLIGLVEYKKLEERARTAQRGAKMLLDKCVDDLKGFEGVDDEALARHRTDAAEAFNRDATAAQALADAKTAADDARRHAALAAEAEALDVRIASAAHDMAAIDIGALIAVRDQRSAAARDAAKLTKSAEAEYKRATSAERGAHELQSATRAVLDRRREIAARDERLRAYDEQLRALPEAESRAAEIEAIKDALPALRQLNEAQEQREKLAADDPVVLLARLRAESDALNAAGGAIDSDAASAEAARDATQQAAAEAEAAAAQLKRQIDARTAASAESTCSRCGQPIDKKRAREEIDELNARCSGAGQEAETARAGAGAAARAFADVRRRQQQHRDNAAALARKIDAAQSHVGELERAATAVTARMADLERVAPKEMLAAARDAEDAAATARLIGVHGDAPKQAKAALAARDELRHVGTKRTAEEGERKRAADALAIDEAKLDGRMGDIETAEAAHVAAKSRLDDAEIGLNQARADADAASGDERTAETALNDAGERRNKLVLHHTGWAAERKSKLGEIDKIPVQHRIVPSDAQRAAQDASARAKAAREEMLVRQNALTNLEARFDELGRMQRSKAETEERLRLLRKLVRLLGKDGLQGLLVTNALNAITSAANAFLQRLTGGSLRLTIKRDGDKLDLMAVDSTCMREPRSVKALSGSQKFRCAVAIASGIGQYAGAGGMRSIVIDEGFGSLDQAGQQLMVQELKQLATHMDKVIVVSHLEAFTNPDDFPHRLVVTTSGDGSRISSG